MAKKPLPSPPAPKKSRVTSIDQRTKDNCLPSPPAYSSQRLRIPWHINWWYMASALAAVSAMALSLLALSLIKSKPTLTTVPIPAPHGNMQETETINPPITDSLEAAASSLPKDSELKSEIKNQDIPSQLMSDPLDQAHAWQIAVAWTSPLGHNVTRVPPPVFSADSEKVMFGRYANGSDHKSPIELVIVRLRDHTVIDSWTPTTSPKLLAWSQDQKRLAYKANEKKICIVDLATKKEISVPLSDTFDGRYNARPIRIDWFGQNKLVSVANDFTFAEVLDLEDLSVATVNISGVERNDNETRRMAERREALHRRREFNEMFDILEGHEFSYIYQSDEGTLGQFLSTSGVGGPFLWIGEKDGTYERPLLHTFFGATQFYVSPNLRHLLVFLEGNSVMHHVLGVSNPSQRAFAVKMDSQSLFDGQELDLFPNYRVRGVPFWGNVYSSSVNPLNGKVTGPDLNTPKGSVLIEQWLEDQIIITATSELSPIQVGDIVTDIRSEQWGEFGNRALDAGKKWFPIVEATKSVESPQREIPSAIPPSLLEEAEKFMDGSQTGKFHIETRTRLLSHGELQELSLEEIQYAINELYARYGADFQKDEVKRVFLQFDWYRPQPGKSVDMAGAEFTEIEKQNVKILGDYRNSQRNSTTGKINAKQSSQAYTSKNGTPMGKDIRDSNITTGDPVLEISNISHFKRSDRSDTLRISVKSYPGVTINPNSVNLHVFFYEQEKSGKIVVTEAKCTTQWISPPVDWADDETETLDVEYPPPDSRSLGGSSDFGAMNRKYYGYLVGVYYKGELQSKNAEPDTLLDMFPLPRKFPKGTPQPQQSSRKSTPNRDSKSVPNNSKTSLFRKVLS